MTGQKKSCRGLSTKWYSSHEETVDLEAIILILQTIQPSLDHTKAYLDKQQCKCTVDTRIPHAHAFTRRAPRIFGPKKTSTMQAASRLLHIQFSCLLLVVVAAVAVEASSLSAMALPSRYYRHGDGGGHALTDSAAEDPAFLDAFQFFHTKLRLTGETGGVGLYYDSHKYIVSRGKSVGINMGSVGPGMISVCIGEALGLISRDEAIRLDAGKPAAN